MCLTAHWLSPNLIFTSFVKKLGLKLGFCPQPMQFSASLQSVGIASIGRKMHGLTLKF
jgi:hypothetical protein